MATYWRIQSLVREQSGFVPKTCWIAHVKERLGFRVRRAHNRVTDQRRNPCPPGKWEPIESAIRSLNQTQSPGRDGICRKGGRKWSN